MERAHAVTPPEVSPHARELLVVGPPFPWEELGLARTDWPGGRVTEIQREADALRHLATHAVDAVVISPGTASSRAVSMAAEARRMQPGVPVIVLAPELSATDIIAALRSKVYACFTLPVSAADLRAAIGEALTIQEEGMRADALAAARARLSADAFARAEEHGAELSFAQVVALARQ